MIQLSSSDDSVSVVTSAAADIEPHVSWIDNASGTITPGRTNTASITSDTDVVIVAPPLVDTIRRVKFISLRNNHATATSAVTVQHTDGTSVETLIKCTLLAGEVLVMDEAGEWHHYCPNGGEYPLGTTYANRDIMEGGTSVVNAVTPGNMHYHPGMVKAWCKAGVAGNALASYNMTSVSDTGAGRATFNVDTDFYSKSWCPQGTVERPVTTTALSDLKTVNARFSTLLVGSVQLEVYDFTASTTVQEDPTTYHFAALGRRV